MAEVRERGSNELVLVFAVRHLGVEREILVLKVKGEDIYAFPPYAKEPLDGLDNHISWHRSGERHAVSRYHDGNEWREARSTRDESSVNLQPPSSLKGIGLLCHIVCGLFVSFTDLHPVGTNMGELIVLDAQAGGFRDDVFFVRAYLVEPGKEEHIPIAVGTGSRILHLVKRTTAPWLAVEVFQQTAVSDTTTSGGVE
jgi:hypothetical protein